ncbi:MAG TPA: MFS transporter [Gammaproteobacteria bacterium]|nr:MFS transporter [Gammaproteobacteria bacterium]
MDPTDPAQTSRLSIRDVSAAVTTSVFSSLAVFLVAALALQIRESLHFGVAGLGVVVSLYYLSAALGSVPLSRAVEAIGALRAMRLGCFLMAMLLIVLAAAVRSLLGLSLLMVAAGVVSSGLQPATNLFLIRRIPRAHHGFAFGIKQAAVPVAVLLGGLCVPVFALTVGWRWAFVAAALLALVAGATMPRSRTSLAEYRARPPIPPLGRAAAGNLILLAVGFALGVAAASALSAFIVTAAAAAGETKATAGLLASLGGVVAAATRIAIGRHVDRHASAHLVIVSTMLAVGVAAYVMLALASSALSALLIPGIVLAFSAGWGWNGVFNLAIASRYPTQAARATGVTSIGGRAGGVVGPLVFGLVVTHASYETAWLLAAGSAMSGALIILAGRRRLQRTARVA